MRKRARIAWSFLLLSSAACSSRLRAAPPRRLVPQLAGTFATTFATTGATPQTEGEPYEGQTQSKLDLREPREFLPLWREPNETTRRLNGTTRRVPHRPGVRVDEKEQEHPRRQPDEPGEDTSAGNTRVAEPREPPRQQGGGLVQQVLRLAVQMDKTARDTKGTTKVTSTTGRKRRGR